MKIVKLNKSIVNRISPILLEFLQKNNCLDKFVKNIEAIEWNKISKFHSIPAAFIFFKDTTEEYSYWKKLQIDFDNYIIQKFKEKHGCK